jgi:polar amino acid transport system substrate-binding protein
VRVRSAPIVACLAGSLSLASAIHAQESTPLRFCLESVNLPMAMPHPDRGIEVEIARAVAKQLGREAVFVWRTPGAETADRAVIAQECDVAPGAVTDPAPLARGAARPGIALTRPYATTGYLLIRRADAAPVRRMAELGDVRIAVETESVAIYTLKQRGHRVHALDDYDAVIRAVADGRVSYGYLWGPLAAWLIRDRDDLLLVEDFESEDRWNFSLAVRAEDTALRRDLDEALLRMLETGAVADIFGKYGVPYVRPQVDPSQAGTEAIAIRGILIPPAPPGTVARGDEFVM